MMSDFERDYLIAYHWSPSTRRASIEQRGLQVGADPVVNAVGGDDWRNPYISLSPTPGQAWWLSAEALHVGEFNVGSRTWDLYEVDIRGLGAERRDDDYPELKVRESIPPGRVTWVAQRELPLPTEGRLPSTRSWDVDEQGLTGCGTCDGLGCGDCVE